MTHEEFNKIVKEFLEKTESVLIKKEGEYSLDSDRFSFFKRMAKIEGGTPEQALLHCMTKHITSFIEMVQSGDRYTKELWFDKLGDLTNYCILLYGLLNDDDMFKDLNKSDFEPVNFEKEVEARKEVKYHGKLNEGKK